MTFWGYDNKSRQMLFAVVGAIWMVGAAALTAEKVDWPLVLQKAEEPGLRRVVGEDQWYFLPADLRHLATSFKAVPAVSGGQDPVSVVVEFHKGLEAHGIHLILLPVPEKPLIRADRLVAGLKAGDASPTKVLEQATGRFVSRLRAAGVDVFDPSRLFREWLTEGGDPVYCRSDTHYTPRTCERLAKALVEKSSLKPVGQVEGKKFKLEERSLTIEGDLADKGEVEKLTMHTVKSATDARVFSPDETSPVLLMGDSHCLVFHSGSDMHAEGAGLFDHLTARLGRPPALIAVRGSGSTSARVALYRKAKRSPEFLKSKKVIIWCFAAREFTQSAGWKKVPLP
jgi:hypothetical protein